MLKNKCGLKPICSARLWPGYVQQYDTSRLPIPPVREGEKRLYIENPDKKKQHPNAMLLNRLLAFLVYEENLLVTLARTVFHVLA
jgi:hypothetical protein